MKSRFSFLLTFALLLTVMFSVTAAAETSVIDSGTCGYQVNWVLDDAGTLTISGEGDMEGYISASDVPWYSQRTSITKVIVEDGVTEIGHYAFADCTNLTSVTIPGSMTYIGGAAFNGCTSLTRVDISDIAAWCGIDFEVYTSNPLFYKGNLYLNGALLTDLVIPDGVTSIGMCAFYNYTALTSVTIPDSVTSIGDYAFSDCTSLTSIKYRGTEAQWNSISKGYDWNYNTGNYTITYNYEGE